jgi:hypothetical protein
LKRTLPWERLTLTLSPTSGGGGSSSRIRPSPLMSPAVAPDGLARLAESVSSGSSVLSSCVGTLNVAVVCPAGIVIVAVVAW